MLALGLPNENVALSFCLLSGLPNENGEEAVDGGCNEGVAFGLFELGVLNENGASAFGAPRVDVVFPNANAAVLPAGCSTFPNENVDAGAAFTNVPSALFLFPKLKSPGAGRLLFPVGVSNVNGFDAKKYGIYNINGITSGGIEH